MWHLADGWHSSIYSRWALGSWDPCQVRPSVQPIHTFFFFFHQLSPPVGEFGLVDTYPGRPHGMQGFDPRHWVLPEHNCPRSLHFRLYSVWLGACYRLFMYFDFNFTFSQIKDCIEFVVLFFFFCFSFAYSFFFSLKLWFSSGMFTSTQSK